MTKPINDPVAQRLLDIVLVLILFVPVLVFTGILALLIPVINHYGPFISQVRLGKNGKPFRSFKLQTMHPPGPNDEIANRQHDARRITKYGKFLQDHGFDELPQLWNILAGQMSFVGPRPFLKKKLSDILRLNPNMESEISEWWRRRLMVRPGLSGWHQIHSPGPKIIKYDLEYLANPSWKKRIEIFFTSIYIFVVGKKRHFARLSGKA